VKNVYAHDLGEAGRQESVNKDQQQGTQQAPEPSHEQAEVVAGGGEHGIDAITISAFEIVAPHPMVVLEMADHGLDGGAAPQAARELGIQANILRG
jgi:NaMN:DMB phosphoribosyltransferase